MKTQIQNINGGDILPEKVWSVLLHLSTNMWVDTNDALSIGVGYSDDLNEQFCESTWQEVTRFAVEQGFNTVFIDLGNAINYVSHPEIAVKNAWDVDKLKAELKRLRAAGLVPIPKLNFSAAHDTWLGEYERMVSTKIYYKVCRDLIHEVIEIFDNPPAFHLGMDEEDFFGTNLLGYRYSCTRSFELFWHDLNYLCDCVREKGSRPMIWLAVYSKMIDEFFKNVPKDVIMVPWQYGRFKYAPQCEYEWHIAYVPEEKRNMPLFYNRVVEEGYDMLTCGSTFETNLNIPQMVDYMEDNVPNDKFLGYMVAPWVGTIPKNEYSIKHDIYLLGWSKRNHLE